MQKYQIFSAIRYASRIFTTSFDYGDKASVKIYSLCALRHLPYTVLMDVEVTGKERHKYYGASVMEVPDALRAMCRIIIMKLTDRI